MTRKWFFALPVLLAALGSLSFFSTTRAGTYPVLNNTESVITRAPVRNYQVLFNSSTVDNSGTAITDPYAWSSWSTVAKDCNTSGGRLLLNDLNGMRYVHFLPLFTTSGATATVQLWRFDYVAAADVPTANTNSLVQLGGNTIRNLGIGYPLGADLSLTSFSIGATAGIFKGTITGNTIYPDQTAGTTYYVGKALHFDLDGGFAWLPAVNTISGGTLIILGCVE